jgi:hypothetical protein
MTDSTPPIEEFFILDHTFIPQSDDLVALGGKLLSG